MYNNPEFKNENIVSPEAEITDGYIPYINFQHTTQALKEKTGIKKAANAAGISLIVLLAISFVSSLIYSILCAGVNSATGVIEYNENPAIQQGFQIIISIFSFTLPIIFVYKMFGYRISDLVSFKKTEKGLGLPLFFFGVAFCAFANIASSYMETVFKSVGIDYSMPEFELPQGIFGFGLTFLSTAIVPALVEEFACRGIILGSLRKFGDNFALMVSSVIFGLLHGNFEQIPFAFVMGLFLGFTVIKTNSLRVAISIHFFTNFISVFFSYFLNDASVTIQNIIYVIFLLVCLILGMLFLKSETTSEILFKVKEAETESLEKEKYKWFFKSAAIIVFVVLSLIEAVSILGIG